MKKVFCFVLAVLMLLPLFSCAGNKTKLAFSASKEAYDNVSKAYDIIEDFGTDIYEAWRLGIYDDDEDDFGLEYLSKELNLSLEDLEYGFAYCTNEDEWETMTLQEKDEAVKSASKDFSFYTIFTDSVFSLCVNVVSGAYKATGKVEEIDGYLAQAKAQMKELSEKYSDYEHYPSLKGFYTTTSAFFDFCQNPTGSFEQLKDTVADYKKEARDYISDLDYIFED